MKNNWYLKSLPKIFDELGTSESGLSSQETNNRIKEYGENKLPEAKRDSVLVIFLRQFQSPLIYVLFGASFIVFLIGEIIDSLIILFVLIFNAIVGSIQEGRAQNTLLALKNFSETTATVIRDEQEVIVQDTNLVPGDIILLQEGEKVPADARIINSHNLKVDEAALTGESFPVHKSSESLEKRGLSVADQKNMVFKGTHIMAGNGRAVVVATGLKTFIGEISKEIAAIDTEIPLKKNIRYLSRIIVLAVAVVSCILFVLGVTYGKPPQEMFMIVVSLAVSVIPEGLPIIMTLVLATGVWRMSKKQALVKRLQAVEALGQTKIICVDKTGTITKNELTVKKIYLLASGEAIINGNLFEINGTGYEPQGEIKLNGKVIDPLNHPELLLAGKIAAFNSNAHLMYSKENKQWKIAGDPTEAALLVLSQKIGFNKISLEEESPLLAEIPFDYKIKYHATLHKVDDKTSILVVGAPENILSLSNMVWREGKNFDLKQEEREKLEEVFSGMSNDGMRVLAMAVKTKTQDGLSSQDINKLSFVGFFAMRDTLRIGVKESVKEAILAGIRVVMITGDHKITAKTIAKEANIYYEGDEIITGDDLEIMSDLDLLGKINKVSVFARVTPEHKIRIIQAYKQRGEIVAMTGDGVNDAPSLVAADLGIAMGKIGTEVAKEASDIVLLDDNFSSIISAVEEGRSIYKTIKKVILYLFSTNIGEVLVITAALFLGFPLPLLPVQIIWLNFVTDGFLDVALAMEPKEKGLLTEKFKAHKKYILDKLMVKRMFLMSFPMMVGTIFLFNIYFRYDIAKALTVSLTVMAVFQWFNAFNCRSESKSIFQVNPLSNKFLVGATFIVIFLQLLAVYNPLLQKIMHTVPLGLLDWLLIVSVASLIIIVEEIRKFFYHRIYAKTSFSLGKPAN